jgi:hypothetical protein
MAVDIRAVFEEEAPRQLARHPELAEQVDALLEVEIAGEGGGVWAVDLRRDHAPPRVSAGPQADPTVRLRIARDDFAERLAGRQRRTDAFVQGKIAIGGDLVTAIKLRKLFAALGQSAA